MQAGRDRRNGHAFIPQLVLLLFCAILAGAHENLKAGSVQSSNQLNVIRVQGGAAKTSVEVQQKNALRIAHVRHILNERLISVKTGKRGKQFSKWARKTGQVTVISAHGLENNYQPDEEKDSSDSGAEEQSQLVANNNLFSDNMRDFDLVPVPGVPSMFPGKPQHLFDARPPSFPKLLVRALKLSVKFAPVSLTVLLAWLSSWFRQKIWYTWVSACLASGGPAFIKWGQWAATREDMFPESLCETLSHLHNEAPCHSWTFTEKQVESSLGLPRGSILNVFQSFDRTPLASGSIAQVHRAVLRPDGSEEEGTVVAVKVRHPNVSQMMDMDFRIMSTLAQIVDMIPSLSFLRVRESVDQFSHTLSAQAHLNVEAHHLEVLNNNFCKIPSVRFPQPFYASSAVIIETFEPGRIVSNILDKYDALANDISNTAKVKVEEFDEDKESRDPPQVIEGSGYELIPIEVAKFIVTTGVSIYLKMLIVDNLMHADLHPGNIMLDLHASVKKSTSSSSSSREVVPVEGECQIKNNLGITLVDAGMVAQLTESESENFIGVICAIGEGDGKFAAECALRFSDENDLNDEEKQAFIDDVLAVFDERCHGYHTNVDLGDVLRGILGCIRDHRVRVDANYATLVVNCLCVESLAHRICPSYNVLDAAKPLLQSYRKIAYKRDGTPLKVSPEKVKRWMPLMNYRKDRQDNAFFARQKRLLKQKKRTE